VPGDAQPASTLDQLRAGTATFRDTAKWIVGGVTAALAGVLVGTPLTRLGELEPGARLVTAIAAAASALIFLTAVALAGMGVITAQVITVNQLAGQTGPLEKNRVRRMQKALAPQFPFKLTTFVELSDQLKQIETAAKGAAATPESKSALADAKVRMATFSELVAFEYKRQRFREMVGVMLVAVPLAAVSIGTFAWAATPRTAPAPVSQEPRYTQIATDPLTAAELKLDAGCLVSAPSGGLMLRTVVVAEYAGWSDLVVLPAANCRPVRLRQQNGRLFSVK
jgi:hypothetical protein